jgi:ParB-like chromosome segregation protein Spo0J
MTQRKATPGSILDDLMSAAPAVSRETGLRLVMVPLAKLEDNPYQTRQANDQDHVLNLAQSIVAMAATLPETKGLQQVPIGRIVRWGDGSIVSPLEYDDPAAIRKYLADGEYVVQLGFGHSRRLAFVALANGPAAVFPSLAGVEQVAFNGAEFTPADYAEMPVILQPLLDEEMWRQAVTENAQRKDISAVEEAAALRRAITEFGMTVDVAAKTFGWARSTAANKLRLLDLPETVQQACMDGVITERHARELCRLIGDDKRIDEYLNKTLKSSLSVAQLKQAIDWAAEAMQKEQAQAAEIARAKAILAAGWTPPGCTTPLPADRLDMEATTWLSDFLTADTMHGCSPDCPCLKLLWVGYERDGSIALSPETSHVKLACTNQKRRQGIVRNSAEAEASDPEAKAAADERQRKAAEEYDRSKAAQLAARERKIAEANQAWQNGIAKLDKLALWGSLAFWQCVAKNMQSYYLEKELKAAVSERDAMDRLLAALFEQTREYDNDTGSTLPNPKRVQSMLAALSPSKRKKADEPAPEEDGLQDVVDRLQADIDAHAAVAAADEAFGLAQPVSQETEPAPLPAAAATELPADLVAAGWQLVQRRTRWVAQVSVPTEDEPIETQLRTKVEDAIADAVYMHKALKIGAAA